MPEHDITSLDVQRILQTFLSERSIRHGAEQQVADIFRKANDLVPDAAASAMHELIEYVLVNLPVDEGRQFLQTLQNRLDRPAS